MLPKRSKSGRNRSWTRVVPPPGSPVAAELLQRSGLSHLAEVPLSSLQRRRAPRPPSGKPRHTMPLLQYVQQQIAAVMDEDRQLLEEQQRELERMRQQLDALLQQQMQWGFMHTLPGQQQLPQVVDMAPTADWEDPAQRLPPPPQQEQQQQVPPSALVPVQQEQQDVPGLALLEEVQQQQAQLEGRGLLPSAPVPPPAAAGGVQMEDPSAAEALQALEQQHQQQAAALQPDPQQLQRQLQEMGQAMQEQLAELAAPIAYDPVADAAPATAGRATITSITNRIIKVLSQPEPPPEQLTALDSLGLYQVHSALKMAVRWGQGHVVPAIARCVRTPVQT